MGFHVNGWVENNSFTDLVGETFTLQAGQFTGFIIHDRKERGIPCQGTDWSVDRKKTGKNVNFFRTNFELHPIRGDYDGFMTKRCTAAADIRRLVKPLAARTDVLSPPFLQDTFAQPGR
ncbi:MAG: hypothetical protein GYA17_15665 [Chloroflexi bacterium]|nr:hypothetical protein [Chloroflexota bacterium]